MLSDYRKGFRALSGSKASPQALSGLGRSGYDPGQEVFGIECEHHYGITTHPLPADGNVGLEVYRLIREAWHPDLRDDNHSFEIVEEAEHWSRVVIRKNEKSPAFAFKPWWCDDGPGALWFSQAYRIATRQKIEAEVADRLSWAARWQKESDEQRDTIRGRKARSKYASLAQSAQREAEIARSRWPEFAGATRSGWQARMHQHRDPASVDGRPEDGDPTQIEAPPVGPQSGAESATPHPQGESH